MDELIEKLKHNIKYHMHPYNLGDNGETETLIMELIRRYEAAQQSVQPTDGWLSQADDESNPPTISS